MRPEIAELAGKISALEKELRREMRERWAEAGFALEKGRVVFDQTVLRGHKERKIHLWRYLRGVRPVFLLAVPVTYAVIVPLLLLDLFASIYQAVCFPIYGIPKVRRAQHLIFGRHKLGYLNLVEKLNCLYCSYANGLISYVREIAGRTEQFWCPIKHAQWAVSPHSHYHQFVEFGDAEAYARDLDALRRRLAELDRDVEH
jgi:hypothetical protein